MFLFFLETLLLLIPNSMSRDLDTSSYLTIQDVTGKNSLKIKMNPLVFEPTKKQSVAFFKTINAHQLQLIYCDDKSNDEIDRKTIEEFEQSWNIPIVMNDKNIMKLILNEGILCKAITDNGLFLFKIHKGHYYPNIRPVSLFAEGEFMEHNRYSLWIQVLVIAFTIIDILTICITMYCLHRKQKLF